MTIVFVHGNPECDAIWQPLIRALGERGVHDTICLSPPGFGSAPPAGWNGTAADYGGWLIAELRAIPGPIDLVGHDWGAGHSFWALAHAPELLRSAVTDCAGIIHPDYVWHDAAQAWQTPGVGEEAIAGMVGAPHADKVALLTSLGLDDIAANAVAEAMNDDMGRCVLSLYRSADTDYRSGLIDALVAADLPAWLVLDPGADPYVPAELGREVADRHGARHTTLGEHGHWWMASGPDAAADAMIDFWSGIG